MTVREARDKLWAELGYPNARQAAIDRVKGELVRLLGEIVYEDSWLRKLAAEWHRAERRSRETKRPGVHWK